MKALLTASIFMITASVLAGDDIQTQSVIHPIYGLISVLVPIVVSGIKQLIPSIPKAMLPILCPVLGALVDIVSYYCGTMTGPYGMVFGAVGVCVREVWDQVRKSFTASTPTILFIGLLTIGLSGCARFNTTQTDVSYENGKISRQITTKATGYTIGAGNSKLATWKASQTDKTQGATVGGLDQQVDASTNWNALVEGIVGAAVKAAIKP